MSSNWKRRIGLTPSKALLVAGLGTAFVATLALQIPGDEPPPPRRRPQAALEDESQAEQAPQLQVDDQAWRTPVAAGLYDPFAARRRTLTILDAKADDDPDADLDLPEDLLEEDEEPGGIKSLQQQGVSIVFKRDGRQAAVIGDQVITVGDVVNGFRVVAIDEFGVAVEPHSHVTQ